MSKIGKSPIQRVFGRTNCPYLLSASKYLTPFTLPLLFPYGSSSLTPTQQPGPKSAIFPTKDTPPLAPLSSLHLDPTEIEEASSERQSGSSQLELTIGLLSSIYSGWFWRKFFFHFLKFSGSLSYSYSLMTYFSNPSRLSICLRIELGLESVTKIIIPLQAPY